MGFALGDARTAARGEWLLERLVATGSVVIRTLGETRAGEQAIHRFLSSPYVSPDSILDTLCERTARHARGHIVVVQDTTEINFKGRSARRHDLGPAGNGRDLGFFIHALIAVERAAEAVVGLLGAQIWTRQPGKVEARRSRAFCAKESARWLWGANKADSVLKEAATITVVGDRESDIFEVFAQRPQGVELVVRAAQDRALAGGGLLFEALAEAPVLAIAHVQVPARPGLAKRQARVEIRADQVALSCPKSRPQHLGLPASVRVGLVEVREIDPPPGVQGLCWRLLTTHPVGGADQAREVVALYRLRWRIEEVFRLLKSEGLALEDTQLCAAERLFCLSAMALAAAVRTLQLVDARDGSARQASEVIDAALVGAVAAVSRTLEGKTQRQHNPHATGSLAHLAWVTGRLGGWNCYGKPPGPKTMQAGWTRLAAMLAGYLLAQAQSHDESLPCMP